ncbi:uncharacterized protein [Anomalospiza imberbis]|uniref:uncharacterized protein isoform X3 n=1 Tax=Anomalospiza imberbis TaxID=187417 RepID=UPI00358DEBC7
MSAMFCIQEMLQRKTEEMSNSLPISDAAVTLIQALKTLFITFHYSVAVYLLNLILVSQATISFYALQVMGVPGVLALFSSRRKNPVLRFILSKVVKGANIAMLAVSICSACSVLAMAYLGCRSLPCCSCYDSVTGMEWLQPSEDQNQAVEMICAVQSPGGRIFNFTDRFPAQDVEEDTSKPPPYIRMT